VHFFTFLNSGAKGVIIALFYYFIDRRENVSYSFFYFLVSDFLTLQEIILFSYASHDAMHRETIPVNNNSTLDGRILIDNGFHRLIYSPS
jgi:hypothetical protein